MVVGNLQNIQSGDKSMKGFLYIDENEDPDADIKNMFIKLLFLGGFVILTILTNIPTSAAVFLGILGLHILSYGVKDFVNDLRRIKL